MASNEIRRETPAHDDIFGMISTGIAGANQWLIANFRDTLYPMKFLRNNSSDFYCVEIQSPHWRKQGVNLDSIHIHYVLNSAYAAGQTIVFNVYYAWLMPGQIVPALASWNQVLNVSVVLDAVNPIAQYTYGLVAVVSDFAPPPTEGYGIGMLLRLERGNGTYSGDLGIIQTDIHALRDRAGSQSEFTDV